MDIFSPQVVFGACFVSVMILIFCIRKYFNREK